MSSPKSPTRAQVRKSILAAISQSLQPYITGPLLYTLLYHPQQIEAFLPAKLHAIARSSSTIYWLKLLLAAGVVRKASAHLSKLVLNNFKYDTWNSGEEIVLITGGARGIGELVTHQIAEHAAKVIVLDVTAPQNPLPSNAYFFHADVTDSAQVAAAASKIRSSHGPPSVLINNAGVGTVRTILDESEALIRKTFDVNIIAHFLLVKEFLPAMIERNHGHVVTVASMASFVVHAQNVDYSCTKVAALAFHEGLAGELKHRYGADKVRTSIIHPSWTQTPMTAGLMTHAPNFKAAMLAPERVSDAIVKQLLSGKGGQVFLPDRLKYLSGIRGWPSWLQESLRNAVGQELVIVGRPD